MKINKNLESCAFFFVFIGVFLFSVLQYKTSESKKRRVFYFTTLDSEDVCTEVRMGGKNPVQGEINYFIEELISGPLTNRFKPLFSLDTRLEFCFQDKSTLYVGLSRDALFESGNSMKIKDASKLFCKNIEKSFDNIDTIVMFIGGKQVIYD